MSDWSNPLLPSNQTQLEAAIATATDPRVPPDVISTLWDADRCPINLLPWLAWSLSVDEWDETWDEATQRRVIATSIDIHRKKGTVSAVKEVLANLGHGGRLIEWWQTEPRGIPYTFTAEVEIGSRGVNEIAISAIDRQISAVKPVRSHYTLILVGHSDLLGKVACVSFSGDIVMVQPHQITETNTPSIQAKAGIGLHDWGTTTIYPRKP